MKRRLRCDDVDYTELCNGVIDAFRGSIHFQFNERYKCHGIQAPVVCYSLAPHFVLVVVI